MFPAHRLLIPLALSLACLLPPLLAAAQEQAAATEQPVEEAREATAVAAPSTSARELLEQEKAAEEILREKESSTTTESIEKGRTPLASVLAMSRAFKRGDYTAAAEYLDLRYLPEDVEERDPENLVRALAFMMNQQLILDISTLSDDPEGYTGDGLPGYRDLVAAVTLANAEVPIYLQRVPDDKGGWMWKISNATVERIPEMWQELGFHPLAEYLFTVLPDFTFMGLLNWQVLGIVLSLAAAWLIAMAVTWTLNRLVQHIPNIFPRGIERFFHRPLRIFLFIVITERLIEQLGLSLKQRVLLNSSGVDYFAWTVLLLGIISLVRDYHIRRLQGLGQDNYTALLRPITNMVKVALVIVVLLVWADNAGYNMTTILTGLGVGSLAVALAAQRTLENLIGAITLYSARPISPGDFCRFAGVLGTVEEIGLRSTAIRTLDRTLVHIPNSLLSAGEIENFTARDRIRYFRNARVLAQSPDQLRIILADIRRTLYSHPMVLPDTVSVRLEDIDEAAAKLRLDAGIRTTDYQEFLAVAEDLNLRFIQIVTATGAALMGPGQLRILKETDAHTGRQTPYVDDMLALWREQDSPPFPNFSAEEITAMRDQLDYPAKA
jgi:MscS family membrane protein